jgi:hypothetical protein
MPDRPAILLETDPKLINSAPLEVSCFVDGIQSSLSLTHRDWRPVHLIYVAAGALGAEGRVLGVRERLAIVASSLDADWARSLPGGVPVLELAEESPFSLGAAGVRELAGARDTLERELVDDLLEVGVGTIVVDGSIVGREVSPLVVGIAKTTATRYLTDESALLALHEGWRSPRFTIPAGVGGGHVERASCYLRLRASRHRSWDYGLVRLEALDPELLDGFAARCLAERQPRGSADLRGDRHLSSIASVETFLRARRPHLFSRAN